MAALRAPRLQVGSAAWISEERSSSLQIVDQEIEEFSYSARNELEWINEHMAGILNENEINLAETFKSPGKFRIRTPQTTRKQTAPEPRMPLSDVFASTSNGSNPQLNPQLTPQPQSPPGGSRFKPPQLHALSRPTPLNVKPASPKRAPILSPTRPPELAQDSGYHGSQDLDTLQNERDPEASEPHEAFDAIPASSTPLRPSPTRPIARQSPEKPAQDADRELPQESEARAQTPQDLEEEQEHEAQDENPEYVESYTPPHSPTQVLQALQASKKADDSDSRSSSETSSPVRPLGRKSSLSFASLPAREPLAGGKSLGGGASRTGNVEDGNNGQSYYQRLTGGKSLGNLSKGDSLHDGDEDALGSDKMPSAKVPETERQPLTHSKTYTQRLQDQISMLGKPQTTVGQARAALSTATLPHTTGADEHSTALAEDDDDDWIDPPKTQEAMESAPAPSEDAIDQQEHSAASASPRKALFADKIVHNGTTSSTATEYHHELKPVVKSDSNVSMDTLSDTPSKLLPRNTRESPLKHVKNKLSSILKSSRGLLASSAAISAEGKLMLSPSTSRLALHHGPSSESIATKSHTGTHDSDALSMEEITCPTRPVARRTRASAEREKEEKRLEKEAKFLAEQNDKLDRAREEQREKARTFGREQEQTAAEDRRIASKTEQERFAGQEPPHPHSERGSLEKAKVGEEADEKHADGDVEMADGSPNASTKSAEPSQLTRATKRPVKPMKETISKAKQAPTVIRVNTGSQTSQFGSRVSAAAHDPISQPSLKAGKGTLLSKSSSQNLRPLPTAVRPKALDMSVKKKEQEEREAQRRRDAKAETERKRAAIQEEQRRHAERQKQIEADRHAQRQATTEKAKHVRVPPSALRTQANDGAYGQLRGESSRPPSRMTSGAPGSSVLSSAVKAGAKRALVPDTGDEGQGKRPVSRGGPSYQAKDAKRRRTSEVIDEPEMGHQRKINGPPVRPSNGFKKDLPAKSVFQNGYTSAAPHSATRDLFKATVTAQHNSHAKGGHPMDMAQISKGPIPFAPNGGGGAGSSHKTPGRVPSFTAGKSSARPATRSSPRFQNGESIELPEIQTDDEDEDEDAQAMMVAAWADSPDLRRALIRQETVDPSQIFGPPAPLNMEEVFNKSKDKWHKFRQRTSSANWNGLDRLTEDDIRKDMAAREKLRRDGGWSYEMSKNL